ncbi:CPBP family intramembrane glutamic endopeptidase [Gulosibacter sp. ACHW.36C]|uniref:CPBP family intramembrane metalloprotease n=1 Tax=Gulosibacter sediminis TaxID=1729695 RepID=A0ABY4N2Q5_9MICO|nr:CPBP family intramembrane glutamic endopeptidase [Gulosibacter sediminis]UQN15803.1 CPBP family intramembrane metalloprotease [Gulosibacter sediminis]
MRLRAARQRVWWEIAIVLSLSLLPSALYAVLDLVELALSTTPVADAQTTLNPQVSDTAILDTLNRVVRFFAGVAPVALVVWLLWQRHETGFHRLGLNWRGWGDIGRGALLAASVGIPGLALYAGSRLAGYTLQVIAGDPTFQWDSTIALVLSAVRAALIEEVVVVAYLTLRLRALGWRPTAIVLASALLRGSYHLYQGIPMALGNVAMGLLFATVFLWLLNRKRDAGEPKRSRVLPLVVAHFILDAVSFLGYPFALALFPQIF